MPGADDLTREDLIRIAGRDRFVKEQLATRCASLIQENLELVSIIQELQRDLADIQQGQQVLDTTTPPTNTGNGDVVGEQPAFSFSE